MLNFDTASLDDKILMVILRDALATARQGAYDAALRHKEFRAWLDRAEAMYSEFCTTYGFTVTPPFDPDQHIRLRLAQGHPDFINYKDDPRFKDVVPFSKPREGW